VSKVCFVVTTPFTVNGFLIHHLLELAKLYEVTLCVNLTQYDLSPQLDISNLNIINVPLERKVMLWSDLKSWCALYQIFLQYRFDSVHSITPKAGLLTQSSAFFARIPRRFHTFTGQIWSNKHGLYRFIFKYLDWLIAKFATFVLADSASQINFLIKEGVCKPSKIAMLGVGSISGVNLNRFRPDNFVRSLVRKELVAKESDCIYLFVGRLCRDKGLFDLFAAFSKVRAEEVSAVLWIVGPDEENVKAQANELFPELCNSIRWIGPTFSPERYMQASDVLLLPSYREGFGSVIIEASACQIPTIAYRIDGVIDAVLDGKTGLLVRLGNILELEKQMLLLLKNPPLRENLGFSARDRACRFFSSDDVTRAWLDFYMISLK
jgi:glycosyltransferase involved in cell wall biosynthesis